MNMDVGGGASPEPSEASPVVLLDDVIRTGDLARRTARAPDYAAENRAFVTLARAMATSPQSVLQMLAEIVMELCKAGSAGISLAERENGADIFRWHATAGKFSPLLGQTLPRDFSPCGAVLARKSTLLMDNPVRYYPYIASLGAPLSELLLAPFYDGLEAVGTLWVVSHDHRRFDSEDARLMASLSDFASAGTQALQAHRATTAALQEVRSKDEEIAERREFARSETRQRQRAQTDLRRAETLVDGQKHALERALGGASLRTVLEILTHTIETYSTDALASILLLDPDGIRLRHGAAPRLPDAYNRAIDGISIGAAVGSCGTAAFRRDGVTVTDIAADPLWADFRELAREHGLRACWSTPILSSLGDVLGTFAIYYSEPHGPTARDREAVNFLTRTAALIIERSRARERERFLVQLDDAVRPLVDPEEITYTAARLIGEHLRVNRCAYATVEEDAFTLTGNYTHDVQSIVGRYSSRQFGAECLRLLRAGEPFVVSNSTTEPRLDEADRAAYALAEIRAVICVPILKARRFVAAMAVHMASVRHWRPEEVELVQHVASRCWESIERARVARDLRESEHQFRGLANSIANLAWMARPDGWIYWYNEQWYAYTGTTPRDMEGWGWKSVHDPEVLPAVIERWAESIATGERFEMVFPIRGRDGEFRRFLTRVNPLHDSHGNVIRWFGTNTDVEAERRATEVLRHAEQAAEAASRAKDEFMAMLGHELRNPLSPMLTALQLMRLHGNDVSERERTVIERQVNHLTRLVDDLLDVSRIARGKVELKREVIEIAEIVARAIEMSSALLEQRTQTLIVKVPRRGLAVDGDPTRLGQVVSNLLTNASKYTPQGGQITVQAGSEGQDVVLRVIDTGIGISADMLPRVFDLFIQERQAIDRAPGGLGLGLTIVRNLVERHGGTVAAFSEGLDRGSELVVRLAKAATDRVTTDTSLLEGNVGTVPRRPNGRRVLVVDDNEDAATMLAMALEAIGYETEVAHDGPQALHICDDFAPDAAFLDIGLPVMDGYELAGRLRELPGLERIRLVAITGYGQESDKERSIAAGFDRHLVKPIDLDVLRTVASGFADDGSDRAN